jgi:hypothetical protein
MASNPDGEDDFDNEIAMLAGLHFRQSIIHSEG